MREDCHDARALFDAIFCARYGSVNRPYFPTILLFSYYFPTSEELTGLGLFDPDGKPRVVLTHRNGWSGCFRKDRGGAIRAGMALDAGGPRLVVQDEQERVLFGQP